MNATATDEEFYVAEAPTAEILPKYIYAARIEDIYQEMFTPKLEMLRDGESADPYPQFVVTYTVWHSRTKAQSTFRNSLKNRPGRRANAGLSKFMRALGLPAAFRKSQVLGRFLELSMEDKSPDGTKEQNWVSDYLPFTPAPGDDFGAAPDAASAEQKSAILDISTKIHTQFGVEIPAPPATMTARKAGEWHTRLLARYRELEAEAAMPAGAAEADLPF